MSAFSGQIPTVINSRAAHALGTVANVNGEDFFPAAEMGDNNIISDLILLGINVNASDANGNSALHLAVLNNHFSTVELLLQNGAEINSTNSNQNTPLHLAVQKGFREIVEQLVLGGADGNAANSDGKSPLQIVEESLRPESSELASARKFQKVQKKHC
jgi:ankyrin repeat protein